MSHAVFFCLQVLIIVLVRRYFDWNIFNNFKAVSLKAYTLCRIVGDKSHLVHAELAQHLRAAAVVALIGLESEMYVCINGIKAFFLQLIGSILFISPMPRPSCCIYISTPLPSFSIICMPCAAAVRNRSACFRIHLRWRMKNEHARAQARLLSTHPLSGPCARVRCWSDGTEQA